MKVLGLMSGTSMDGLDCCYADIEIENNNILKYDILKFKTIPFARDIKQLIFNTIKYQSKELYIECDEKLGIEFLKIVDNFINKKFIDLISVHGQTITHIDGIKTVQIGNPKYLYDFYNVPVIYDFRTKDIDLGGRGAPLIPYLDWLLSKKINSSIITINLGGIANITYIPKSSKRDKVVGFDTGPGMCLIDQFVQFQWRKEYDLNGEIAKKGFINDDLLDYLFLHPFISKNFPKSTSREEFNMIYIEKMYKKFIFLNKYDILRTLVFFTAKSIYRNIKFIYLNNDCKLFISGGGVKNNLLMNDISKIFNKTKILTSDFFNIDTDVKEAFLMAVMGLARYKKIYNNMPSVTGAKKYDFYGKIYK